MKKHIHSAASAILVLLGVSAASAAGCTSRELDRAEKSISSIRDWSGAYRSYSRFQQCDDGFVADDYADKIVGLFINQWDRIIELNEIGGRHPNFIKFVIKHLGEEMSPYEAALIEKNIREKCPESAQPLCRKVEQRMNALNSTPDN